MDERSELTEWLFDQAAMFRQVVRLASNETFAIEFRKMAQECQQAALALVGKETTTRLH
jgi:hypothetical protein